MRNQAGRALRALRAERRRLSPVEAEDAVVVLAGEATLMKRLGAVLKRRLGGPRARVHGALDLGVAIFTGKDFVIAHLEGDCARTPSERRRKGTPLRDVATLGASLRRASLAVLLDETVIRPEDRAAAAPWARAWEAWVLAALYAGWLGGVGDAAPRGYPHEAEVLLDALLLEETFADSARELERPGGRPAVPLRGAGD